MPGNPFTDPMWAANIADTIERSVNTLRDKTTRPLLLALRIVIFGLVAAIGGVVALVLLITALVRLLIVLFDLFLDHPDAVWVAYLFAGALFTIAGLIVLHKRFPGELPAEPTA